MLKILRLMATAAIPAMLAILGYVGSRELWDVNLLEKFRDAHFNQDEYHRRLSPYLVRQMKSGTLQRQLRQFIFWDVMERNFTGPGAVRRWDPDRQDWHLLGDAMLDMKNDLQTNCWDGRDWFRWWTDQQVVADDRWAKGSKDVLNALYAELYKRYYGKDWKRETRPSCAKW